ncbi:MAG: glycosyltransferase family 39 protein [Magnetococcus sp. YQC-9]
MNRLFSLPFKDQIQQKTILSFVLLIAIVFSLRFFHLTEIGVSGSDNFLYWHYAVKWSHNDHSLDIQEIEQNRLYRPVSFYLFAWALKIFDYQDYAIKLFNIIVDAGNAFLVFLVCRRITNLWLGGLASLLYVCIPELIAYSRSESLHTLSFLFLLMAVYFLIRFLETTSKLRLFYLTMSGLALSEGGHVHPSILLNAPGFFGVLLLDGMLNIQARKEKVKRVLVSMGVLMTAICSVYLILLITLGLHQHPSVTAGQKKVDVAITMTQTDRIQSISNWNDLVSRMNLTSVPVSFIKKRLALSDWHMHFFLSLFLLSMLLLGMHLLGVPYVHGWNDDLKAHVPWIALICFILTFALGLPGSIHQLRDHLQLLPIFVIGLSVTCYTLAARWLDNVGATILQSCLILFILINLLPNSVKQFSKAQGVSHYRQLHDNMSGLVNEKNKILLMDNPADRVRPWSIEAYFGKNAVYYDVCNEKFSETVHKNLIKFIVIPDVPPYYTQNSNIYGVVKGGVGPVPEWTKSCYQREIDTESMKRATVSESGWWHHRVLNASLVERVVQNHIGEIIYRLHGVTVLMLYGQESADRARALAEIDPDPTIR